MWNIYNLHVYSACQFYIISTTVILCKLQNQDVSSSSLTPPFPVLAVLGSLHLCKNLRMSILALKAAGILVGIYQIRPRCSMLPAQGGAIGIFCEPLECGLLWEGFFHWHRTLNDPVRGSSHLLPLSFSYFSWLVMRKNLYVPSHVLLEFHQRPKVVSTPIFAWSFKNCQPNNPLLRSSLSQI